jgi:hypothetical protein
MRRVLDDQVGQWLAALTLNLGSDGMGVPGRDGATTPGAAVRVRFAGVGAGVAVSVGVLALAAEQNKPTGAPDALIERSDH